MISEGKPSGVENPPVDAEKGVIIRREVILRDKNDKVLGYVNYEVSKNVTTILIERKPECGQRLLSLTLRGLDGKKMDLIKLFSLPRVEIYVRRERSGLFEGRNSPHREVIFCPFPDDQIDLAILLHELGHAEQSKESEMKMVHKLYSSGAPKHGLEYKYFLEDLKTIGFFSSECEKLAAQINDLLLLKAELFTLEVRGFKKLVSKDEGDVPTEADNRQMALKIVELRVKIKDIEDGMKINELIESLHIIHENDANARALSWMHIIEKAGINILAPQKSTEEDIEDGRGVIHDPYSELRQGLLSYCIVGNTQLKELKR